MVSTRRLHCDDRTWRQILKPGVDGHCVVSDGHSRGQGRGASRHKFRLGNIDSPKQICLLHFGSLQSENRSAGVGHSAPYVSLRSDRRLFSHAELALRSSSTLRGWVGKCSNCWSVAAAKCAARPSTPAPRTIQAQRRSRVASSAAPPRREHRKAVLPKDRTANTGAWAHAHTSRAPRCHDKALAQQTAQKQKRPRGRNLLGEHHRIREER